MAVLLRRTTVFVRDTIVRAAATGCQWLVMRPSMPRDAPAPGRRLLDARRTLRYVSAVKNGVPKPPSYPIESVDNALKLLHMLREQSHIRVSDASRAIGVARSTAHRLLAMLQHHGFVQQDPFSRAYIAGPALLDFGLAALRDRDIRTHARPFLEALGRESGETVHLAILQGGSDVLFLDCVESMKAVRVGNRTGLILPAHCSSAGKALLAALPPAAAYTRKRLNTSGAKISSGLSFR